jgi:hypothetical protein
VLFRSIWIWGTGDSVPPRCVVFIPKDSQHNLPCKWLCPELLGFWWWGMTPFLARSLCFRFTSLSLIKKPIIERCSSFVHVRCGAAIFKPALWWRSACLHYTATYRILFITLVTCLPSYRTMARYFEFLSQFYDFHLTHLRISSTCRNQRVQNEIFVI